MGDGSISPAPDPDARASRGARRLVLGAQSVVRVLWLYVVPALLAALALKFLVPAAGTGFRGWIATAGHDYPVASLVALFLAFSACAHYWRFHLPGGRYASALPFDWGAEERDPERLRAWASIAETRAALSAPIVRRWIATAATPEAFERHLAKLDRSIDAGALDQAGSASRSAAQLAAAPRAQRAWRQGAATAVMLATACAAAFGIRAKLAQSYVVLGSSMLPTLEPNDRIGANKLAYASTVAPRRGDVVVFRSNAVALGGAVVPGILVKRVVGLPGDTIRMDAGTPVINGWPVPSCDAGPYLYVLPEGSGEALQGRVRVEYLDDVAYLTVRIPAREPLLDAYVVRPGEVFVLGDDRPNSLDSRAWNQGRGGGVPLAAVEGRAQWFLVGTHRSGEADLTRFGRALDSVQHSLRIEGIDATSLDRGVARCLAQRPERTHPPPPDTRADRDLHGADHAAVGRPPTGSRIMRIPESRERSRNVVVGAP